MRPIDYAKALGVGVAVLALNMLITTLAITVYSLVIKPGQPQGHYAEMAPEIGTWTGPAGGIALMFAAGFLLARRRPERNGLFFVAMAWGFYTAIDVGLALALAPVASMLFTPALALLLTGVLAAGLVGAGLARRRT